MSKRGLDDSKVNARPFSSRVLIHLAWYLLVFLCATTTAETSNGPRHYVPPELQASDPGIKALLDSADASAKQGNYVDSLNSLQKAMALATKDKSISDKAIVESRLAVYYFTQGKLEEAKSLWLGSLADGISVSNLVLQADVLVALSALSQQGGNLEESLKGANQALDLARRGKNLYIQSRALGELSRLQLIAARPAEARASIEEALQIDRFNRYDWEPGHLLYLAWVTAYESKIDKAIELAVSARNLAVQNSNYITFMQASFFLANAYVHNKRIEEGIQGLERARNGVSEQGTPLFESQQGYNKAVALPYFKISFEEALAMAYQAGNRPDDALKAWQELYDTASSAGFTLAKAESARNLADLYRTKKEYAKAIDYYDLAAEASESGRNEQHRIEALEMEAPLLFQQGQKQRALQVDEELLPLVKASRNVSAQFVADVAIAEILDGTGNLDRVERALKDAESLVDTDLKVPGVEPGVTLELYFRLADLYQKQKDAQHELVAIEKAITPAIALSSAAGDAKNGRPLALLVPRLEVTISNTHIREAAERAYTEGKFADALIYFELLRYFDETEAAWKNKYEEYTKSLSNDPTNVRLIQIPAKLISQDNGAIILADNLKQMGPIANPVRLTTLGVLTGYYMSHQRTDMVVEIGRQALPFLHLGANDTPTRFDVAMSCELSTALMLEKDLKSAVQVLNSCMTGAKRLAIPELLVAAHQTNVWVLEAAGKHDEAQESIQFLLKQTPDDPLEYVQLAQIKAQQQNNTAAADAWRKAIQLYEARKNLSGEADAHLALANLLTFTPDAALEERRSHLQAADDLYRQLGSKAGQVNAESSLGIYYAGQKDDARSHRYFEGALKIAREVRRIDLEAYVLSQIAQAYEISDNLSRAAEYYRKAVDLYEQQDDPADEAFQLKSLANVLNSSHKPEEALQSILKAKSAADRSGSWSSRYWVRRTLAILYGNKGQYQDGVSTLREAKEISDDANQPLSSAWAALDLAAGLETIGNWQEASEQINSAIPILEQFKDIDDESSAYVELMAIYGARESDLQDLPQALHYYQMAYQLITKTHPDRAAALDLDLTEIYWDQGRFKDAVAKATEALDYYRKLKDDLGEAGALVSLAESQRSYGDLAGAAKSLQLAEPLVHRVNNFYTLGRFLYGRAGLYRAQGRLNDAIAEYEEVIKMLEHFKSGSDQENRQHVAEHYDFIYDELIDANYALARSDKQHADSAADKAFEYAELNKAQSFSSSWGHAFVDGLKHQVPVGLQDKEATLVNEREALLSDLQKAMMGVGKHSVKQVEEKVAKLGSAESELQDQLRRTSPAYAEVRYPQRMNIQQIPLHPGELLVQLKMLNQATLVWLVSGTEKGTVLNAFYRVDRPRQWFADRVFRIRDAFNGGHPEQFDSKITDELLGALFPDSVIQNLRAAKAIIFVPDDILFLLPFEMLSSHGQFLLLGTATEYFPSSAALRLARTSIHATGDWQESFIGIADPITSSDDPRYQAVNLIFDSGAQTEPVRPRTSTSLDRIVSRGFSLERLPGTADEVQGIASLFASKADTRTGMDATKQELLRTDLARYKFVHFATHGILPVESGIKEPSLLLSYDGRGKDDMLLTLSEILDLKLRADMVVLSACNTGSGKVTKAEGVASLGSAFLAAGASSVTVSLWHVADNSTAELMQEFYKNLVKGKTKSESLAAARSALFSKEYVNHNPYFWAPFVLTGE
jgi:CHAT domain-containing protein/tetratricopeptide (TPR) repeat protein